MSESSTKKRKYAATNHDTASPTKKTKKREQKNDKQDKGKAKYTEFQVVTTSLVVSVAPIFAGNPRAGVEEMLDSMTMRYNATLRGVVLSHSNLRFLSEKAFIHADCPFLVCKVEFDVVIWRPRIGVKLVGNINLCSPDHISLLLHRTFNVSIPRHHIPTDKWAFEYGPAENDPEFGSDMIPDQDSSAGADGGKWVHHLTRENIGGDDGFLEFTVIGYTIANDMLSLVGSIQPDPFSPEHIPESDKSRKENPTESEIDDLEVQHEITVEGGDVESDGDTFTVMANKEPAAKAARQDVEAVERKEKKRKKKASNVEKEGRKQKKT